MSATTLIKPAIDNFINKAPTFEPIHIEANHVNTSEESTSDNESRFAFLYKFKRDRLSNIRPLGEFFDKNRFNYTSSFPLISQRWNYNLQYFSSNYFVIMLGLAAYSILTNWWLMITIGFIFGGLFMIKKWGNEGPIDLAGYATVSTSTLYVTYACGSLVLLLFSGATGTIFWIIGASALLVLGHAALMEPGVEEGFADSQV